MDNNEINYKRLPWFYRLVLKLPKPTLENSSNTMHGLFYGLVLPILMVVSVFVNVIAIAYLPTPVNLLVIGSIVGMVFLIFLRIQLERFINSLNAVAKKEPLEWNIDKSLRGYFKLIQKTELVKGEESED